MLVGLLAVGQPHRDELGLAALGPQFLRRELGEPAGEGAVLTAADAENEPLGGGRHDVVLQELHAGPDLRPGVDRRPDAEFLDDLLAKVRHIPNPSGTPDGLLG
ncbi:hypothetical protein AIIKEEIJ_01561 [Rhodococcus sp. YH1]|nr:hypothetical protein [Rhodococcus sp. YH1]